MRKKNVLFVSEASYLSTGYATYSREVLNRLHKSGKYNIAEFSIYGGSQDKRRETIPWKNYPNLPEPGNEEQNKAYNFIAFYFVSFFSIYIQTTQPLLQLLCSKCSF